MQIDFTALRKLELPYFFFVTNRASEIVSVSKSVREVFGYNPQDLLGKRYSKFFPADILDQDVSGNELNQSQNNTAAHNSYRSVPDARGQQRVIHLQCLKEIDDTGQVESLWGVGRDVSHEWLAFNGLYREYQQLKEVQQLLKDREQVVLRQVLEGRLNKSIARELEVSERTIELDRKRLIDKFSAPNSAALISKAARLEVLEEVFQWLTNDIPGFAEAGLDPSPTQNEHSTRS